MDIRIEDLFYIYESNNVSVVALRGLHLNVASGECLVINGPNGSGKSTLVKLLTGFFTPTAGRILIGDQDIAELDPLRLRREFVASIDQRGNLLYDLTILQNVALGFALLGHARVSATEKARQLLENHGLSHLCDRYPDQLSAGERQFSSLLATMATNPKVLIADEPSGELDNESAEIMYRLLKTLATEASVILVTHDARAESYADRVVRIREGRISEEWRPGEDEVSVIDPFGWMRIKEGTRLSSRGRDRGRTKNVRPRDIMVRGVDLSLAYGGKQIFSEINIDAGSGELIAFSSTSGSGKSSLLRILAGIQNPSGGEVFINGRSLKDLSREDRANRRSDSIGFLSQGGSKVSSISLADHFAGIETALGDSFKSRLNRALSTFSGGERARIELLRVLADSKPIYILDEPTSQMDEHRSAKAVSIILERVKTGALVIVSTREQALLDCADHVVTLT